MLRDGFEDSVSDQHVAHPVGVDAIIMDQPVGAPFRSPNVRKDTIKL